MTCRACGGPVAGWIEVPGGEPADPGRYALLRCGRCGSAVTAGEPPGAEAYATGQYAPVDPRAAGPVALLQRLAAGQPVRLLRRAGLPPAGRVLDAGAGRGHLVRALAAAGYDAAGIDPAAERASASGAVKRAAIADHSDSGLDAVVLWHVLEHLDDPAGALARIRSWLRPTGLLLVAVPNAVSLQARIAGTGWVHWDAPRHRAHFTPRGLRELVSGAGFEVEAEHHWLADWSAAGMWMALLSRLGTRPGFPFHWLKRNVRARPREVALTAAGVPLLPVAVALEAGAAVARRGGAMAVVAGRGP